MESVTAKANAKGSPINRVVLNDETVAKLDSWIEQMEAFCPGIRLKRQHLFEWLVAERETQLSPSAQKSIKERFYDDIELATWALEQLKAAKARHEKISLNELLQGEKAQVRSNKKRQVKKKSSPESEVKEPQIEAPDRFPPMPVDFDIGEK